MFVFVVVVDAVSSLSFTCGFLLAGCFDAFALVVYDVKLMYASCAVLLSVVCFFEGFTTPFTSCHF